MEMVLQSIGRTTYSMVVGGAEEEVGAGNGASCTLE